MNYEPLKHSGEFEEIYKSGQKWHSPNLVVFYKKTNHNKVGYTVSKKIGNAVKRNFAKRRMRALFQAQCGQLHTGIYVFVAKAPITQTPFEALKKEFLFSLRKLKTIKS